MSGIAPAADRRQIALWGLFGIGNLGNEASLSVAVERLRRLAPAVDLVCVCRVEDPVRAEHGIRTHPTRIDPKAQWISRAPRLVRLVMRIPSELVRVVRTAAFLRRTDIVIAPGTGILDDFGLSPLEEPFDLWIWSTLARVTRTPFWFVSVGAGPIDGRGSRALMLSATKRAWLSYRDEGSRTFMASIGHDVSSESVAPDLVFSMRPASDRSNRVLADDDQQLGGRTVGLGVMAYDGWRRCDANVGTIRSTYVSKMIELCLRFLEQGWTVSLLIGEESDLAVVDEVRAEVARVLGAAPTALVTDGMSSFRDLLDLVAGVDLVVATRFHNVIAALISEKPVISIEYATKNSRVMNECGLGDFCHHAETFSIDEVLADVERLLATFAARRPALVGMLERKRELLEAQWEKVESEIVA